MELRDKFNWLALIVKFWLRPEFIYDKFVIKDTFISLAFKFATFVIVLAFKLIIWALFTPNRYEQLFTEVINSLYT